MQVGTISQEKSEDTTTFLWEFEFKDPELNSEQRLSFGSFQSPTFSYSDAWWYFKTHWTSMHILWELAVIFNIESRTINDLATEGVDFTFDFKSMSGVKVTELPVEGDSAGCGSRWCYAFPDALNYRIFGAELPKITVTVTCQKKERKLRSRKLIRFDTLGANLHDLFGKKETCDVFLIVQDQEFRAHRAILIARSPVFAAMFTINSFEKESGLVTIPDCDPESFHDFLQYLYSGTMVEISIEKAYQLYFTADKYDVKELKSFCASTMAQCLTVETWCDVVSLADLHEEEELLSSCQAFFKQNLWNIMSSPEWHEMMQKKSSVGKKMLEAMSSTVILTDKKQTKKKCKKGVSSFGRKNQKK